MEIKKLQVDDYKRKKKKKSMITLVAVIILIVLTLTSLTIGQYGVAPLETLKILFGIGDTDNQTANMVLNIVTKIRIPRTLAAILIGGALAISGVTYQCVFRNMLVSQDVLGVSTGACVGAAIAIVLDLSSYYIQGFAFVCGIITVVIVFLLSKIIKTERTLSLILSGVLVGGLMSSILGYIKYTANPETHLQNIIYWIMGDISSVTMEQLGAIAIPAVICLVLIYINRWKLNFFCYSDVEATNLGFNIKAYRVLYIICATVLVSLAVSVSGSIGWIGLVIPQLARTLIGTDNIDTVGLSFAIGANFLLLMDVINRLISAAELPISILTGMIGTPIFVICLIIKQRREQMITND